MCRFVELPFANYLIIKSHQVYYKEDDLTVIVLSNNRDISIRKITYNLKETALGLQPNQRKNVMM